MIQSVHVSGITAYELNMNYSSRIIFIEDLLTKMHVPLYRNRQVFEGIYQKYAASFDEITVLPKEIRDKLKEKLGPRILCLRNIAETKDTQADKVLFETCDHNRIEAVRMAFQANEERIDEHRSLCISSQSGCALGCTFCATGAVGLKKNLEVDEITDQILFFLCRGQEIDSISFMGMGEPFANPNLFNALKIITDKDKMAFNKRKINISTVGIVPGIKRLQKEFPDVNLAFSLHSPFPEERLKLMPITKTYPIAVVMQAIKEFIRVTNKRVFLAYVLLAGVNDTVDHAKAVAKLIQNQGEKQYLYHVNVIRFNAGATNILYKQPSAARVAAFRKVLSRSGIKNTLRQSFGTSIHAACGQLYAEYGKRGS